MSSKGSLVSNIKFNETDSNGFMLELQLIPDYRLRPVVRVFFKPFVASCPADCYDSVVVPVLAQFTPFSKYYIT